MRIDVDSYREILDTLTRKVALIGGGQGLKEMLEKNFEGFAQNTVIVWSQQTSKPYKGFRKGRWWSMDYKDLTRLHQRVPELNVVAPGSTSWHPPCSPLGERLIRLITRIRRPRRAFRVVPRNMPR